MTCDKYSSWNITAHLWAPEKMHAMPSRNYIDARDAEAGAQGQKNNVCVRAFFSCFSCVCHKPPLLELVSLLLDQKRNKCTCLFHTVKKTEKKKRKIYGYVRFRFIIFTTLLNGWMNKINNWIRYIFSIQCTSKACS